MKWEKADFRYEQPVEQTRRDYSFEAGNAGEFLIKSIANAYWFFISDVDGDNCPFRPSCSTFFIESVAETNIPHGTLMFFDRFTRDMNVFKKHKHYPRVSSGFYYDPPELYTLNKNRIEYIPPSVIVEDE